MSSWVIVKKLNGKAVFETFDKKTADTVNEKFGNSYTAIPIIEWLAILNRNILTTFDKPL